MTERQLDARFAQPEPMLRSRSYVHSNSLEEEYAMDWNRVEGNWKEAKGKIKEG